MHPPPSVPGCTRKLPKHKHALLIHFTLLFVLMLWLLQLGALHNESIKRKTTQLDIYKMALKKWEVRHACRHYMACV